MLRRLWSEAPPWLTEELRVTPMQRIAVVFASRYLICFPALLVFIAVGLCVDSLVDGSPLDVPVGGVAALTAIGGLAGGMLDILADLSLLSARGRDSRLGWSRSTRYWRVVFRLVRELVATR
jgi:hypothetical protein